MQEYVAAGIINLVKVDTVLNLSDFLAKGTSWKTHHLLAGIFFGWCMARVNVDISSFYIFCLFGDLQPMQT